MSGVDLLEAGLNTTGSLLSVLGTSFILFCYLILPHKQHVRHALIVNLTLAGESNAHRLVSLIELLIRYVRLHKLGE